MIAQFMRNTKYANTEFEMQLIPGFTPRRSGMSVSRFEYSARDCDCSACAYKTRKNKCTSPDSCVCLRERLVAGCVPLSELLGVLTEEVQERPFVARVSRLSCQPLSIFESSDHQMRFEAVHKKNLIGSAGQTAAVFLLTADPFLWSKARLAVVPGKIDFPAIHIHGVDLDGYVLFHTAKDLYAGTKHISLSELTDPELVSDEAFRLIVTAFLIRRYGAEVLCAERSCP
ncbi:hypothetical protein [Sinanaerobacter chloroacetimidivorans]|uniref:Uncharacterized protein n=1 Tax=Sinanaerobacter chloroacetimidivorans TaxID=2818044 RepID=A0A8J7VX65_9FIRM|nr:hypothetical protein [Sinanaerobacter chloroacetimidivorans]MBR0596389.1 hypothetical protein [Sinanaerobacter chloroacetimidivorans]